MDNTFISFKNSTLAISYDGPQNAAVTALFLYGGGKIATKISFHPWQEALAKQGIASVSLDYSGCGDSSGHFEENSLSQRIDEAICCVNWIRSHNPETTFVLYGSSMGAYTALGVFSKIPHMIHSILLIIPAAYTPEAHDIHFGPAFTQCIKKDKSWMSSQSFTWIESFTGNLVVVAGAADTVVPIEIPRQYMEHAKKARKKSLVVMPDVTHSMLSTRNILLTKEMEEVFTLLVPLITAKPSV